ncbi:serine/threonine-protein kinase PknD [Microbulbifer aestuariivivens]|uniref:Serine/threonine-protein kinase PknD n=1 Tax=Microbulbifer aestuariivivens TaxID=1908308 RepID=A0ABP9WT24_9GAMM
MLREEVLEKLGLDSGASAEVIQAAITGKRESLSEAAGKAPTDALKEKYEAQLQQLEDIERALRAASAAASPSPLSQTKLADLPQSATQFEAGTTAAVNLQVGQLLAGRYEVRQQIGAGGMGAVYRALDKTTGKEIALKVLLPALLQNENARERFLDEARISQQLSHPNIVNVYDVQQDGDFFFLTMELLQGQDLRQVMENRRLARQQFSLQEVQDILKPLCEALAYAHEYTVHRDLKPENIWLSDDGKIKIMDFGIARVQSTSQRTQTGAAMGTAYYMAPEQLRGVKELDGRADQYALAVMAYELLSGEVPAGRIEPLHTLVKGLPRKWSAHIDRALSAKPEARFADIAAFQQALMPTGGPVLPALPWKGIGIAAGVLVALLGIGSLAASGSFNLEGLKNLLPMSKEEIAAHKASLAKIQGEIKVLRQRLDTSRRSLDSDVRAAERNNSDELAALLSWQQLSEDGIFAGSQLTTLEGDLSMAETLLRENAFEQAQPVFERVRKGYAELLQTFDTAGELHEAEQSFDRAQSAWEKLTEDYGLANPAPVAAALEAGNQAQLQQRQGAFPAALANWQEGTEQWRAARASVAGEVARIDSERQAQIAAAAATRKRQAAKLKQLLTGNEMIPIPGGSFVMGDDDSIAEEKPAHRVAIKSFAMSRYEVTFAQYDAFAAATGRPKPDDEGWGRGNRPVINVSWGDATAYAQWLSKETGKRFRLPSEAEWEYAARAGSSSNYSWGDKVYCSQARFSGSPGYDCGNEDQTVPVGSFAANDFGLHDMHGNVYEWAQDCKNESYIGAPVNGAAWTSGDCTKRALRGGSWAKASWLMNSEFRDWGPVSLRDNDVGIRLVLEL